MFTCLHVAQLRRPKLLPCCITCLSADNLVFPLFLMENNFHHCRHRKVATRHTLPNIQMSLSLRKFSMMKIFLFLSLLSACTGCVSYFRLSATWGEGVSDGGQQVVDMGRDSRHWLWNFGSRASVTVHWMLSLLLSTDYRREQGSVLPSHLPTQPTIHPPPGFFPASHPRT